MESHMTSARWMWNSPAITSESFDDEVVIVNFDSGKYHSLQGSARIIWQWLDSPSTIDGILARAAGAFTGDREAMDHGIHQFLTTLQHEQLIVSVASDITTSSTADAAGAAPVPFTPPQLHTFSDMQELLLLDPIHDVDEAGWPVAKENGGN